LIFLSIISNLDEEKTVFNKNICMKRVDDVLSNIKQRRKVLGYTLEEFSEIVGLSSSAYYKIEAGKSPITVEYLFRFTHHLKIGIEEVFELPL
jgi:transcriptional regulator with XRE-family HTH domain